MQGIVLKAIVVYVGAFVIGLVLVSFPASSTFLKLTHGFSDQDYGAIFLPQLVLAIAGALGAGYAVQRMSLKHMYVCALVAFLLSQLSLGFSIYLSSASALYLIMFATACFGFGFGFGGGPLNGLVCYLFPNRTGSALTTLHMMAGAGLMSGPLLFRAAISVEHWIWAPSALVAITISLLLVTLFTALPGEPVNTTSDEAVLPYDSGYFWLMIIIAILYAFSEGTFSNWAIIYINEVKQLSATVAATALSVFWGGLTLGRLLVSFVLIKFRPIWVWLVLTLMMVPAFIVVAQISTTNQAIVAFAFAGFACSAFFPLMVAVASEPYPNSVSWIASMLTAALMFGVGVGSYAIGNLKSVLSLEKIYTYSTVYPVLIFILILFCLKIRKNYISE